MQFPLTLSFKIISLSSSIRVLDANGSDLFFVKKKKFRLKEQITVFSNPSRAEALYQIHADRIIDFSAKYHFIDSAGAEIGAVKRRGRRSIWRAHYDVFDETGTMIATIQEEDAWVKVMDSLFGSIPILGLFAGYFFNPVYHLSNPNGTRLVTIKKQPGLFESLFTIEETTDISEKAEIRAVLAMIMLVLLERERG